MHTITHNDYSEEEYSSLLEAHFQEEVDFFNEYRDIFTNQEVDLDF